jgi:hypothetical protein
MKSALNTIAEIKDGIYWANLYGRVYKKPTSFHTVEQCLSYLAEFEPKYNILVEEFGRDYPNVDLDTELEFYKLTKSGLFKDVQYLESKRDELGLNSVEAIEEFRRKCSFEACR